MDLAAEELEGHRFLSGYFRDGQRRIDLVLVAKDTMDKKIEKIKLDFLANILNMGMELEIEGGFDKSVMDLIFIKVHATDRVIRHFGFFYNMKKYFKKSHVEFIYSHIVYEKELIKTIRRWYPGPGNYSTMERATIVYKALLSCPFGKPFNHVGINQLIDNKIFLDVYPLHDGPFQLTVGQTPLELNGRQALYYTWCGLTNLFTRSPVHLIREYLGERVAFLFTFYQFYNWWLSLLAVTGAAMFASNYCYKKRNIVLNEHGDKNVYNYKFPAAKETQFEDLPMCPKCADPVGCPFRNFTAYERELRIRVFLANPYNFILPFVVAIWGIFFYTFWKRRQNYLHWMWECTDEDAKNLTRPEYRATEVHLSTPQRVPVVAKGDRLLRSRRRAHPAPRQALLARRGVRRLLVFLIMLLVLLVIFLVYFPLMVTVNNKLLNRLRYVEDWLGVSAGVEQINHAVIDTLGAADAVLIVAMEYVWSRLARWLAKFDNAHSEWLHEETHSLNLFGVSLLINLLMLCYYAFLKGALYSAPNDAEAWRGPLGLGMANCGLLTCIDETFILFVATYKTKTCIRDLYRLFERATDDRPPAPPRGPRSRCRQRAAGPDAAGERRQPPCWEREFLLKPLDETYFWKHLNRLLLQYAAVTLFMACFQLGPLCAFLWNIWHQNYMADMIVRYHRRPLMTQTWGLGPWDQIVLVLPYLACFFNSLFMAKHNTIMHLRFNNKYWSHHHKRRFLADYYIGFFNVSYENSWLREFRAYKKTFNGSVPGFCMFPGQINRLLEYSNRYMPMAGFYYILWHQALLLLIPMLMVLLVAGLLRAAVDTKSRCVADTECVEDAVKSYDITEEMAAGGHFPPRPRRARRERSSAPAGAGDSATPAARLAEKIR